MGQQRLIRLTGWCGLYTGLIGKVPEIWNDLELELNKEDKLDIFIRDFLSEEMEDDTVDINIDDRLGACMVKGRFGTALGCNYTICHYGITIFAMVSKGAEKSTE